MPLDNESQLNDTTDNIQYNITKHAKERYAERIMDKEDKNDMQRFIITNEEKIQSDIMKMINYGKLIYTGKQTQKDSKSINVINVFISGLWVILVDTKTNNVITLYKIDLGCGDDLNKEYMSRMMDKLDQVNQKLIETILKTDAEKEEYTNFITQYESQINEYKSIIANMETMCNGYKDLMKGNVAFISNVERELADVVNTLIGKKEF